MKRKKERDIEKGYSIDETVSKLRRMADALENGTRFRIQIAGEQVSVPANAIFTIEHERQDQEEEIEFQFKWKREAGSKKS